MFRFASPWLLALAPLAVAAAWWMTRRRRRADARLPLPGAAERLRLRSPWVVLDGLLPVLRAVVLLLVVAAIARPQAGSRLETVSSEGVDIVVALDNSTSMLAEDFRPRNRLAVAKQTVGEFVEGRPNDRIGLVVFSGIAATRCPLTLDHDMLQQFLDAVGITDPESDGTAIGMALASAVNRLRSSKADSRVVVLVTDGRNNRGELGPEAAAEAARALGVKIYAIGVGKQGEAPFPVGSGQYRMLPADVDEELLGSMAETTGGQYFRATDPESLRQVFRIIDSLEKTEIDSNVRVLYTELFPLLLAPALGLLLFERLALATRLRRLP